MKRLTFIHNVRSIRNAAYVLGFVLSMMTYTAFSSVQTKQFSSNINICKSGGYITLANLVVFEQNNNDFDSASATQTYTIAAPSGFQFKAGTGSVFFSKNTDFSLKTLTVTSSSLVLSVSIATVLNIDTLTITGLQIEVTTAGFSGANLNFDYTSGQPLNNGISNLYFGHLNPQNSSTAFSLGSLDTMCVSGGNQSLTGLASPAGGTFSGTGVTGSSFSPSTAGTGTFTITYTDPTGCSATDKVTVLSSPVLNFSSIPKSQLCSGNNSNISIVNTGTPSGGNFSGNGVSGTNFNPNTAGPGGTIITYAVAGCGSVIGAIEVNETPAVTFFGLASSYCSNAPDVTLTGFPSNGTFSGNGINGTTFSPSSISIGNTSVNFSLTVNGCTKSISQSTQIEQAPSVSIVLSPKQTNFTSQQDSVLIGGTQNNPSNGGVIVVTGSGVSLGSDGKYRFFPNTIGQGTSVITRTLTAPNGCKASDSINVSVDVPNGETINGLSASYCANSSPVTITSSNGSNGPFYGIGVVDSDQSDNKAIFDPSQVPSIYYGESLLVIFEGSPLAIQTTIVYGLPSISIAQISTDSSSTNILGGAYCSNDAPVQLSTLVSPTGGIGSFSGTGVSGSEFNPTTAIIGNNTITYTYTDPSPQNCQNTASIVVNVRSAVNASQISFSGLKGSYCATDTISQLIPIGPKPFSSKSGFSGLGLNSSLSAFDPSIAVKYNDSITNIYNIKYTYVSLNGCATVIDSLAKVSKIPQPGFSGLNSQYCYSDAPVNLIGTPSGNTGIFKIIPASGSLVGNTFSPQNANPGVYTITYIYKDPTTQCHNDTSLSTLIHPMPIVTFTNLDSTYCYNANPVQLNGYPLPLTNNTDGYSSPKASIASGKFSPSGSGVGKQTITYTYSDQFGCSASVTQNTTVYGIPELSPIGTLIKKSPAYHLSSLCENDSITFSDSLSVVDTTSGAHSYIQQANWSIDGTTVTDSFSVNIKKVLSAGVHTIGYSLVTNKGCVSNVNTLNNNITIGSYPVTNFTYGKVCNTDSTDFINTTTINVGNVDTLTWNFSDGTIVPFYAPLKKNGNIKHNFASPKTYDVILKATSNYNCSRSDSQKVFILPSLTITASAPYSTGFEKNDGGWVSSGVTDTISTWVRAIAKKSLIKSLNVNNPADTTYHYVWVTDSTRNFNPNEISYVYSPCFNFKDVPRPMIHFDYWSATNMNESGVNLEYSTDDSSWTVFGAPNTEGINWYNNTTNIISRPAGVSALNQNGWTGMDSSFRNARHVLDDIVQSNPNVRFRISFAGLSDTTNGFAFDNMWIGERSRLILLEHFTNASNPSNLVAQENKYIDTLVSSSSNFINDTTRNVVALEYHTSFGGNDPIYNRNIPDAGARALFYGVNDVPESNLDGLYYSGSGILINQDTIDTRTLYDPQFSVALNNPDFNISTSSVNGHITITNNTPVKNPVTLYISLAERFVNNLYVNGNVENFQWVHAKFLPDAAGTSFQGNWTKGQTESVPFSWTYPSGYLFDPESLIIIAFVQDNVSKEVYQTAYKSLGAGSVTAVFNPSSTSSAVSLYPNPTNDVTTVVLNGTLNDSYTWNVVDDLGRIVDQGTLQSGTDGFRINTAPYASGFYTLRLNSSLNGVKVAKFVVVH
jgi:hypothetical protein